LSHIEDFGRLLIGEVLDRHEKQHGTVLLGQFRESVQRLSIVHLLILLRVDGERGLVGVFDRDMMWSTGHTAQPCPEQIMEDGEYPGARAAIDAPLMPAADGKLRAILHQIVGCRTVPHQTSRIAAQGWDDRLDETCHVIHDRQSRIRIREAFAARQGRRPCQRT
jgi:hypothetical protein